MAVFDNAKPILPKHGALVLTDATGVPLTLTVPFSEAVDLGPVAKDRAAWKVFRNRGANISAVPTGTIESTTIKCKVQVPIFTHATELTILDWIRRKGSLAALVSTLGAEQGGDELWTYKAKFTVTRADFGIAPSIEYNFCVIEFEGWAEGGSAEEAMTANISITCLFIGANEAAWLTVT